MQFSKNGNGESSWELQSLLFGYFSLILSHRNSAIFIWGFTLSNQFIWINIHGWIKRTWLICSFNKSKLELKKFKKWFYFLNVYMMPFCFISFKKFHLSNICCYCLHTVEEVRESCPQLDGLFHVECQQFRFNADLKLVTYNKIVFRVVTGSCLPSPKGTQNAIWVVFTDSFLTYVSTMKTRCWPVRFIWITWDEIKKNGILCRFGRQKHFFIVHSNLLVISLQRCQVILTHPVEQKLKLLKSP